jgi:hypothetical protein
MNTRLFALALALAWFGTSTGRAAFLWIEGEKPSVNKMNRHPWWYDQVKRDQFSGADFISNFDPAKPGLAEYQFTVSQGGEYEFWVRANPLQARLSYALNGGAETPIDLGRDKRDDLNVAADNKPDLRFLAWCKVGRVTLPGGANKITFRMTSANSNHGYLDCFVLSTEPFQPRGKTRPDQMASELKRLAEASQGWFPFDPRPDPFTESALDLRFLNERFAGENGFIGVREGEFIHTANGRPERFWAVNGPPANLTGAELRRCARTLAKRGINLVRVHGGYFNQDGEVDPARVRHAIEVVEAMKAEGIYTHFSIYFPLWFTPKPNNAWLPGYDGKKHPFAALEFNPEFQARYRQWWTALLTTPSPTTGKPLIDEPALASLEMQNEDSFFFWTFTADNVPDPQLRLLEKMFGDWLVKKYGTLEAVRAKWGGLGEKRDQPAEGRVGFRPLWNIANERKLRDQDTAAFLLEVQTRFYAETKAFLRKLGFKGPVTASNWATASPEYLGPLEKLSYTAGDFIDRHGYFECNHKGDNAAWSVRDGHTWSDRSALRFDPEAPGKPRLFFHPAMDVHYDGLPSMISETTWCRPNRFRSEAPLYYAAYGALQHTDGIVHFALDGGNWVVKPGFFMQQWTLMSPAMMGQFPAAALIFRRGLVTAGAVVAEVRLNTNDLLALKGTPLPQDAGLDELRMRDVPQGVEVRPGQRLNPLLHFVGRAEVRFGSAPGSTRLTDLKPYLNTAAQTVASTTGELKLDYGRGVLTLNAARAQGVSGLLKTVGAVETRDLSITTDMELAHIILVSLDDQPLATSSRMLLQVMTEEKESNRQVEQVSENVQRLVSIGTDPWLVREFRGTVGFRRPDAAQLRVTALDFNGYPAGAAGNASGIRLQPTTLYYLISK